MLDRHGEEQTVAGTAGNTDINGGPVRQVRLHSDEAGSVDWEPLYPGPQPSVMPARAQDVDLFGNVLPEPATKSQRTLNTTNTPEDGVFGWFKYVQDFPGDFATAWLRKLVPVGGFVWEPFCGSGTTPVAAQLLGFRCQAYDINPFMIDVARAKLDWDIDSAQLQEQGLTVADRAEQTLSIEPETAVRIKWSEYEFLRKDSGVDYPGNDDKLKKWISPQVLTRSQALLREVNAVADERCRRFLRLAAAQILIPASNMTFRPNICYESKATSDYPVVRSFRTRLLQMLSDYKTVSNVGYRTAAVDYGDARSDGPNEADVIFTSPPYPNDMEYVHQTRLELALLNYVSSKNQLTDLKKKMISSSVKLVYRENEWQKRLGLEIDGIPALYDCLADTLKGRNWGWNAADMVAQFFGGMRVVCANWHKRLRAGGIAAVVIGDSAFNGVPVKSDTLLATTAHREGFEIEGIEPFRARWNPKHKIELRESVVVLRKGRK